MFTDPTLVISVLTDYKSSVEKASIVISSLDDSDRFSLIGSAFWLNWLLVLSIVCAIREGIGGEGNFGKYGFELLTYLTT